MQYQRRYQFGSLRALVAFDLSETSAYRYPGSTKSRSASICSTVCTAVTVCRRALGMGAMTGAMVANSANSSYKGYGAIPYGTPIHCGADAKP